tara:strand:+ start:1466 stop:1762 length:297 start_codon:yes stop_codon:yes gene_type:complete
MKKLKNILILISLIFLTGCFQTTAFLGPGLTVATNGNVFQAGLQYGANNAIKQETGKYPIKHIKDKVEERKKQKKFYVEFQNIIENRIKETRKKLFLN